MVAPRQITAADIASLNPGFSQLYNFSGAKLPKFRAAMGRVSAGTGNARILCCGDSTTAGLQSIATTGKAYQRGYPVHLSRKLAARLGVSSNWQGRIGTSRSNSYSANDDRFVVSGGFASLSDTATVGGGYWQATAAGTLSFTPTQNCDTFKIWYMTYAAGSFNVNLDGGSATLASYSKTNTVQSVTVTGALAAHTLNCVWASGTATILAVECWDSTQSQVQILNAGSSGSNSASWANNAANYQSIGGAALLNPDLCIFDIGINDYANSITPAQTLANINTFVAAQKAAGIDVILKTFVPSAVTATPSASQQTYIASIYAAAAQNDVPLIDVWTRWGTQEKQAALGLYFDTLHPVEAGYADVGSAVATALLQVA
jgi:lysophospholipase L1-like esterase